ncbi:hypothetical protein [Archangium violaceum]|uniref:Uncharacterized protein n=1 Tax=Archangium violaceum Cb vi76 TaxID=1406225 RepID=A0A084SQC5_9BACT|nr:hypothetical protein [Archangium violaceum]KFA90660.1 hypothetical protein Q664_27115 [Archangium violaceum Cb vi76]
MAGKFSKTTTPGSGYTDAVTQSRPPTDSSGRGVPDERRAFSEQREGHFPGNADDDTVTGREAGYGADPSNTPPGLSAEGAGGPEDAGTESDEAPSGRVQGG